MPDIETKIKEFRKHDIVVRVAFVVVVFLLVLLFILGFWFLEEYQSARDTRFVPPPNWNEQEYLMKNPDVAESVRAGKLESGWQHYVLHGVEEGRPGVTIERLPGE